MVTVLPKFRSGYKPIEGVKMEDRGRGMIVLLDDGKQYIGLRRLTCHEIREVEEAERKAQEVAERLTGSPKDEIFASAFRRFGKSVYH